MAKYRVEGSGDGTFKFTAAKSNDAEPTVSLDGLTIGEVEAFVRQAGAGELWPEEENE